MLTAAWVGGLLVVVIVAWRLLRKGRQQRLREFLAQKHIAIQDGPSAASHRFGRVNRQPLHWTAHAKLKAVDEVWLDSDKESSAISWKVPSDQPGAFAIVGRSRIGSFRVAWTQYEHLMTTDSSSLPTNLSDLGFFVEDDAILPFLFSSAVSETFLKYVFLFGKPAGATEKLFMALEYQDGWCRLAVVPDLADENHYNKVSGAIETLRKAFLRPPAVAVPSSVEAHAASPAVSKPLPAHGQDLLLAFFGGRVIARVKATEVPVEKNPVCAMPDEPLLELRDSVGASKKFDLSSLRNEATFLHFSIRVGPSYAVQADCLLSNSETSSFEEFAIGRAKGVRLQPFLLPQAGADPKEFEGKGLFARGLHYSGDVTPGNVSLLCVCDHCQKTFRLQSFHAGFSNLVYFYCHRQPHTLVASSYAEGAPAIMGPSDAELVRRFEAKLPPCRRCGGTFRYRNPLRCPHCVKPYIDFERFPQEREVEYYGNYLYGDDLQEMAGDQ